MQVVEAAVASEGRVFHTLDALRGIAAICVVTFHMSQVFSPFAAAGGYLAVDLFFMMSGVVLSHAYEGRFRAGMGTYDFMRLRFIRLYPLYFLGTLLGIAVTVASMFGGNIMHWESSTLVQAVLLALLFLPNLSGRPINEMFPLNIPCWSLFLEILVNLLFVVCWPLLTSRRVIVVSLLTGGVVAFATMQVGNIDQGSNTTTFAVGLARTVFGFCVGVLIARHIRHAHRQENNLKVLAIVAVAGIAIGGRPTGEWRAIWDTASVLVIFPFVVYCGTLIDPSPRFQKISAFLGLTSYAVYVLHSPLSAILNSVTRHFADADGNIGAPYLGVAVLVALLTGCWLVDRYLDNPIRRLLSRIIPKKQTSRASA